ncbi:MAG: hypothetical protein IMZ50_15530 [Candidatus Atribacteria bacterium]|nr:hypothetical protein [Candidatus Atribacteria bacterium]
MGWRRRDLGKDDIHRHHLFFDLRQPLRNLSIQCELRLGPNALPPLAAYALDLVDRPPDLAAGW